MVTAKENMKVVKTSPELKKHIKDFFKQGLSVTEVSNKLNIPYHTAYAYSPLNKKRLAKAKRLKAAKPIKAVKKLQATGYSQIIQAAIEALETQAAEIKRKIDTLKKEL